YSILRATTENFMWVLAVAAIGLGVLVGLSARTVPAWIAAAVVSALLVAGFFSIDAKVWGVVLMGVSVLIFFFLPWLDRSPVKSIRYKGSLYKCALAIFVIAFVVLGYLGTQTVSDLRTLLAQIGTVLYFAFFALMPWYSRMDRTRPVPDRVTW
ncbi:MAG: cytochrome, partial [Burkholderiales bacterium]|nr:cytochrome [Burkholderiales bacterium]